MTLRRAGESFVALHCGGFVCSLHAICVALIDIAMQIDLHAAFAYALMIRIAMLCIAWGVRDEPRRCVACLHGSHLTVYRSALHLHYL